MNLRGRGRWITAYIKLPEGYTLRDINMSSILLNNTIPAAMRCRRIRSCDGNDIPALMVKLDREDVLQYILSTVTTRRRFITVTLTITGTFKDGTPFQGNDTIRVVTHFHHHKCACFSLSVSWR